MTGLDDALLVAYADGELDMTEARDVELLLEHDPVARQKVRAFRETGALLRAAFRESAYAGDVPESLRRTVAPPRPAVRRTWRLALPLAASIVGAALFGGGYVAATLTGPAVPGTLAAVLDDIADYHVVYAQETDHLVEVPAARRAELEEWLGSRLHRTLHAPDLSGKGLTFQGGRLLVADGQPVAQFMYTQEKGAPIAVCVTFGRGKATPPSFEEHAGLGFFSWQDDRYTYVVVGTAPVETLRGVTEVASAQL